MEGNPRHSSGACKHGGHSLAFFDTSFHITNLDSKEPILILIQLYPYRTTENSLNPYNQSTEAKKITYLFLEASTPARLGDHDPASLNARPAVAPLVAPMQGTAQRFIASSPAKRWCIHITWHPLVQSLPTGARPLPLKRAITALPSQMAPFPTHMLPTSHHLPAWVLASETPLAALPL